MQKEEPNIAHIKLEIKDPDLKLLNTNLYTTKKAGMSFWDVLHFTRKEFFEKLDSYKLFGRTNYSHLDFHFLTIISCNGAAVKSEHFNKTLPKEPCQIVIEAIGKHRKVNRIKKELVNAKFLKIADGSDRIKMRERNKTKNFENRHKKLMVKFGSKYSFTKFQELKLLKEETVLNKSRKLKKTRYMTYSHPYKFEHCEPYCHLDK